jgi:hypothetical protein
MKFRFVSTVTASVILLGAAGETVAGGQPVECLEPYRSAPVYDTVYEDVLVNPGSRRVAHVPPIYGTRKRAVVVSPARESYEIIPAVTRTEYRTVRVSEGGYSWEWRWINGRKVLCKIKRKARYGRVAETVVVQPAHKRRVVNPAEYGYEQGQVLIQPEQQRVIETPPSYETVARQVMVSEGSSGWKRVRIRNHCAN